jgi:aspartyl-tRNA(Asn)/glutamyl-tRNA(Gln) amidotransferase subunit A
MDIDKITIKSARKSLDRKEFSSRDLAAAFLDKIREKDVEINAFLEVFDDVDKQAKNADKMIQKGDVYPLTGIPLAIKDNILIKGRNASAASRILEGYKASYDADVIFKLKEQGAIFIGRTNMDEFAMGSSTENSAFGPTKNPHDVSRVPGGSSGGSAAAVAAGFCLGALGSDTGGSVRQPASFCGVVGMKPTYGIVSRSGLIAMGSSLDQIGTFTKTNEDAQIIFDSIKGHDSKDSTSLPDNFFQKDKRVAKVIGVPRNFLKEGVDEKVIDNFEKTLDSLKVKGYEIRDIELPSFKYALGVYYIIMPAEASTNLARFDGIRYGLSIDGDTNDDVYSRTRRQGFGKEVRRRVLLGTFVLSSGYVDAYYRRADSVRNLIKTDIENAFKEVDVIATPTTPTPAFKIGEKSGDPLSMYAADIFTVPVNLAGVPAISIPSGFVEKDGKKLPVGFQLISPHGDDGMLFTIGSEIERR